MRFLPAVGMTMIFLVLRKMEGKCGFAALSLHHYTMKEIVMLSEAKHLIRHKSKDSDSRGAKPRMFEINYDLNKK